MMASSDTGGRVVDEHDGILVIFGRLPSSRRQVEGGVSAAPGELFKLRYLEDHQHHGTSQWSPVLPS